MRFVNGMLAAATTLLVFATAEATVNFTMRSLAARRLAERSNDLNAEALLLLF